MADEHCECEAGCTATPTLIGPGVGEATAVRSEQLRRALRLEYLTVGWNLVEGVVAIAAAVLAGSVALLGFGIDSFVESTSGAVMIWRLRAEQGGRFAPSRIEAIEHRALRLVGASLFVLAAFVAFEAVRTLWQQDRPEFTAVGIFLTALSLLAMQWLARAKRRVARDLGSHSMEADAFQTTACMWLSATALVGIALNGLLGWWWADPIAALAIAALVAREGAEAWKGERDCC